MSMDNQSLDESDLEDLEKGKDSTNNTKRLKNMLKHTSNKFKKGKWIVKIEELIRCNQCDRYFCHQQKHDHDNETCDTTKTSETNLQSDFTKNCDFCKQMFPDHETLRNHIKSIHMKTYYTNQERVSIKKSEIKVDSNATEKQTKPKIIKTKK